MSRLVRELLRRSPRPRFFSTSTHQTPPNLVPPICIRAPDLIQTRQLPYGDRTTDEMHHPNCWRPYPGFSFGHFLSPTSVDRLNQYCIVEPEHNQVEEDRPGMVYADSVKKKRKRKMNKHKLKKLRKRMRRKT